MTKTYTSLRTNLAKVKGLGAAHNGTHHWWHQRLTSIFMVPLFSWLVFFIYQAKGLEGMEVAILLKKPYYLLPAVMLIVTAMYHGLLGMQVIIEDYIPNLKLRYSLLILLKLFSFTTIAAILVSAIYFIVQN